MLRKPIRVLSVLRVPLLWLGLAGSLALAGCYAGTAGVDIGYGYGGYYVGSMPADIDLYPHVYYQGNLAYLVNNQWYYRSPRGWVGFRGEPPELYAYRQRQPGFVGRPYRSYAAPRGYYGGPRGYAAPARPVPGYVAPARPAPRYVAPARRAPRYEAPPR